MIRRETGESAGSITGCLVSSVTGAFLMRPPTRRIPSKRIGLKGANLLLWGRKLSSPDWRHEISSGNDLFCTQRTMILSASNKSDTHKLTVLGSGSVEVLDKTWWKSLAVLWNKATNLRKQNQSENQVKIRVTISFASFFIDVVHITEFLTSGSSSETGWELGWRGQHCSGCQRNSGPFFHSLFSTSEEASRPRDAMSAGFNC